MKIGLYPVRDHVKPLLFFTGSLLLFCIGIIFSGSSKPSKSVEIISPIEVIKRNVIGKPIDSLIANYGMPVKDIDKIGPVEAFEYRIDDVYYEIEDDNGTIIGVIKKDW